MIFDKNMDETTNNENFMKYPPNSNPPKGLVNSGILKNDFLNESAGMLPKLQDFNQMFRQYANSVLNMNESVFPPGHPLFNRCLLYTSPSPRDRQKSRMPSSA